MLNQNPAIRNGTRLSILALVLIVSVAGAWFGYLALSGAGEPPHTRRGLEQLLGISLPDSTTGVQLDFQRRYPGEYESYVRFEIGPRDLDALFSDPTFQPLLPSRRPLEQIATASRGQQSMDRLVLQERPAWWKPETGATFVLGQRSQPGPEDFSGPDMSWYIVDTSDAARLVVYAFVVEV